MCNLGKYVKKAFVIIENSMCKLAFFKVTRLYVQLLTKVKYNTPTLLLMQWSWVISPFALSQFGIEDQ